jgi:hypothetical protein
MEDITLLMEDITLLMEDITLLKEVSTKLAAVIADVGDEDAASVRPSLRVSALGECLPR